MIDYSPFWETLEASDESWYTLTKKHKNFRQHHAPAET